MTYALGAKSLARLEGVHPDMKRVVLKAIGYSVQDFTVQEGLRSLATQQEYVRRKVSKTLNSKHLKQPDGTGHAVDLVPWVDGGPRWEWGPIYDIAAAMRRAAIEESVAIRWGGVWDKRLADLPATDAGIQAEVAAYCARHPGPDFIDGPHFELI